MVGFRGTDANSQDVPRLLDDIRRGRIGGIILFDRDAVTKQRGRNIVSTTQVRALVNSLQRKAPTPLFIAVDQEGGRVRRLRPEHGMAEQPSAAALGKESPAHVFAAAKNMGTALAALGITLNFAPSADVGSNPESPAIAALERAFSPDAQTTALYARTFAQGLGQAGIIACYKHFPGHGSAKADTHLGLADISDTWSEAELVPYLPNQRPQGIPLMMMTGHLFHKGLDAQFPASLSHAITTGLLREKLQWDGVIITDDLQMQAIMAYHSREEAIMLAVNAGADIILFGNNLVYEQDLGAKLHAELVRLVETGKIPQKRILESWKRIMALKEHMPRGQAKQ